MPSVNSGVNQGIYKQKSGYGVDAVLDVNIENRPFCEHGPTLLFERYFKDKTSRRFFACSACRARKQCNFFQWEDEKLTDGKELLQKKTKKRFTKGRKVDQLQVGDYWCFDCAHGYPSTMLVDATHAGHSMKVLEATDVAFPTQFLNPIDVDKANAQYFFTEETCKIIRKLAYKTVVCIGTPRLFEVLCAEAADISSLLLDIDERFQQFYSPSKYFRYNMFNHFFFDLGGEREKNFEEIISGCKPEETLLIIDPPFGGLIDVLQDTLSKIWCLMGAESVPTMLVFPYFLENHVMRCSPSLLMHDYKVSYTNHPTYRTVKPGLDKPNPRGSPVRLYTNIPSAKLSFPTDEYRFCKVCQRYVYLGNRHCKVCNACTSKDGRSYVHCEKCNSCVKPNLVHCETCKGCKQEKHTCGEMVALQGCHVCGRLDHKRRDCPRKEVKGAPGKKRKSMAKENAKRKKKKMK